MMTEPTSTQWNATGNGPDTRPYSKLAIVSLVLGILFLCLGPLGLIPMILGIVGITRTTAKGPKKGMGFAIAGCSLGSVGVLGTCLSAGIFLPALGAARVAAQRVLSQANMNLILSEHINYANEHDDQFLPLDQWPDAMVDAGRIDDVILESPAEDGDGVSYIFLSGESTFDTNQIVLYEDPKHYYEGVLVGFADGHVEMVDHADFEQMLADQLAAQEESP